MSGKVKNFIVQYLLQKIFNTLEVLFNDIFKTILSIEPVDYFVNYKFFAIFRSSKHVSHLMLCVLNFI